MPALVSAFDLNIGGLVAQVSNPHLCATFLGLIKKIDWTLRQHRISLIDWIMQAALWVDLSRAITFEETENMKFTGLLLLVAGWAIVVAAVILLPSAGARTGFVLAGIVVELFGLALMVRAHLVLQAEGA